MSDSNIQVGVIGIGDMGSQHARNLATHITGASVVALMDLDEERLMSVAAECGVSKTYIEPQALIADDAVDAVIIATPDATHAELTLACLAAEKPALCEKPLATNAADAERVFRAEITLGRRLVQVGFMREYDPAHRKVKAVLDAGELGAALLFRGFHYNMTKGFERHIHEVITNSAIHDIHSAHWLMGQEIVKVFCQYIPNAPERPETCRLVLLHLTFRDGSLGLIQVNAESGYGYEVDVEITCETGQVTASNLTSPIVRQAGGLSRVIDPSWMGRFEMAYLNEMTAWTQSIKTGQLEGPTAWDGYTALAAADAAKRSSETGQPEIVSVVERPDFYPGR